MASTRNHNTPGNYNLEKRINDTILSNQVKYGEAHTKHVPVQVGHAIPGNLKYNTLSENACDIESMLYGIGSTNLVDGPRHTTPRLKTLSELSFFERPTLIMPQPLAIMKDQRALPLPKNSFFNFF